MWNDIKIVHGKPRHGESQGSVERANRDIEAMLATWMETNSTKKWAEGLRFVQALKNRAYEYHEGTKCSPYEAMFGVPMKLGIANSVLPRNVTVNMTTAEDLEKVINMNNERTDDIEQRFPNFFHVGTTFISQNVQRTTQLLSPLKANCLRFSTTVCDTQFTLI
jgi:hypothetical protein